MNAGPDVERRVSDWLAEEVPTRAPDRILPAAFERSRQTRQRRFGAAWRSISMNRTWQLATAAVVGILILVLGVAWLGGSQGGVGGPAPAATPSPIPSPTPTPQVLSSGDPVALEPGRRYAFPSLHFGVPTQLGNTYPKLSFTVPSGWSANLTQVGKDGTSDQETPYLFAFNFDHGYKDPCTDHTPVLPAAGSGAAGLLGAIAGQPGIDAGPVIDVTVDGHDGAYADYTVTADPASCGNGQDGFWIWGSCPAPVTIGCENLAGDRRYGVGQNSRERAYAIDVDGTIYTFFTSQPADLLAADRPEFQQVLDSIEFEPAN
jgi:hypothetical protein